MRISRIRRLLALAVLGLAFAHTPATAQTPSVCDLRTAERVVAIGDVHGAYDAFIALLRETMLIDARDRWIGGRAILVQTGDVLDRGADSRKVLDLLRRLERDAARAGGRVLALLGNHEVMRMIGDWRYVSEGEYAAFRTRESDGLRQDALASALRTAEGRAKAEGRPWNAETFREQFVKDVPLGFIEMRQAFGPQGEYGRWLRTHVAAATINDVLFVHGGISPRVAALGCAGINQAVAADLRVPYPPPAQANALFSSAEDGPLWYRGLSDQPGSLTPEQVGEILTTLKARAIVIGHTVTANNRVAVRYDGRVLQIDTGMLRPVYTSGAPSALEFHGTALRAVYVGLPSEDLTPAVVPPR